MISRFAIVLSVCMFLCISAIGLIWKPFLAGPLTKEDFVVRNSSCPGSGSIILKEPAPQGLEFSWTKPNGDVILDSTSIHGLDSGQYVLTYKFDGASYELKFEITEVIPHADDQNDLVILCGEDLISVQAKGIIGVMPVTYKWEDSDGKLVGESDFVDLKAGQYYLTIVDANKCRSEKASIKVADMPRPSIIETARIITSSSCMQDDGSITGIYTDPSDTRELVYTWRNSQGTTVGSELNLINAPAGRYQLIVSLKDGSCEAISAEYMIDNSNPITFSKRLADYRQANCRQPSGSVTGLETNATRFRWIDSEQRTVSDKLDLVNVKEGYYQLILTNDFGCETRVEPFHVQAGAAPIALESLPTIKNDNCNLSTGSIIGANAIGSGIRYSWTDADGKVISTNPDLTKVRAGDYYLTVRNSNCSETFSYTVQNIETQLPTPSLQDKFVCSPTDVLINFMENAPIYRIYGENGNLLRESNSKNFLFTVGENVVYYGALANGTCESPRTAFKITVGEAVLKIPSSFTPNNDGINDTWVLKGIELYNSADVRIFNRYGAIIYQSTSTSIAFDGKSEGNDLPPGVYFYMIKLTKDCNPFTGSVTIIR